MTDFTFIDLFAGIGGIRLPFDELGGKCVFGSEIDKYAALTYSANFNEFPHGDITQICPSDICQHDLLLAGFPCQPFSQAGKQLGFQDDRGTMFFYIAEILNFWRPQAFLLENVKRLSTHEQGKTLKIILLILKRLGYSTFNKVLSAKDFGVPQNRERTYIVGFQDKKILFDFPLPESSATRVGDILDVEVDPKYTISERLWEGHQRRKLEHRLKGNGFGYTLVNKDNRYTNTISARYWKDGSEILIEQDDKNPRVLTPRECARLQGYPDSFEIPVSDKQAWKQFGNSVAVPVIRAIAKNMITYITPRRRVNKFMKLDMKLITNQIMEQVYNSNNSQLSIEIISALTH